MFEFLKLSDYLPFQLKKERNFQTIYSMPVKVLVLFSSEYLNNHFSPFGIMLNIEEQEHRKQGNIRP